MKRRELKLDKWERETLEEMRDHHRAGYLRMKAAALLKVADGKAAYAVAREGLLKPKKPDTVYGWMDAYEKEGLGGLYQEPRRKRSISPL